jgi:Arc/MetJ-type ribon-helix-helix transcriptional regulator
MSIQLKPETERLVQQELESGRFRSVDELIVHAVRAWREKQSSTPPNREQRQLAIARMRQFADDNRVSLRGISIKELIHEGHRV